MPIPAITDGPTTFGGRVLATIAILTILAGLAYLAQVARIRVNSVRRTRLLNAALAIIALVVALIAGGVFFAIWNLSVVALFESPEQAIIVTTRIVITLALVLGVYLLTGVVHRLVYEFTLDRTGITQHQTELVYRTTQVSLYILTAIVVFGVWDLNLGGLLVGAGFLGIVVGLAARQTLGSLIAGFVLMFSRPFEIGDWIAIGDREGIVTEISIVNTRIQTFDGEYAMVPNDVVSSNEIINRTRKGRLRLNIDVGVDYDTDLDHAMTVAKTAMTEVDKVMSVPQPHIVLREFGASSIVLGLRCWIDNPSARRRWRAQTAVIKAVKTAFDDEGIKIPFPQRELMSRTEAGGFHLEGASVTSVDPESDE